MIPKTETEIEIDAILSKIDHLSWEMNSLVRKLQKLVLQERKEKRAQGK